MNGQAAPRRSSPLFARPWMTASRCWSTPIPAIRRQQAIEIGKMLIDNGISHFEEPCPYWEYEQTRQVTEALSALPIDVTGGEQDCELPNWRWMIDMKAVDIVQPDICYLGGLTRTLRVADMAAQGRPALHAPLRQLVDGHSVHHAHAACHPQCRQVSRVLDRGRRLLSLAGRPLRRNLPMPSSMARRR
jgi:hypothetical protein